MQQDASPFFVAFRADDGDVTVHIDTEVIESGSHAGILLADFSRHMAIALAQTGKAASPDAALNEMLGLFQAEINNPTDTPRGGIAN
ncbi:DUF5076 domain-containing protein [Glycocaulis abyssi]|uniref:DUF5076 domain-containing protein n=1 Tax=Glycocaulis abyssi TaxID=1433403 RepID=A0ABV9N5W1_9PROT